MIVPAFNLNASFALSNEAITAVLSLSFKKLSTACTFGYMLPLAKCPSSRYLAKSAFLTSFKTTSFSCL